MELLCISQGWSQEENSTQKFVPICAMVWWWTLKLTHGEPWNITTLQLRGRKIWSFRIFLMPMNKERRSKPTNQPHFFCFIELISKGPRYYSNSRRSFNYKICKNALIIQSCLEGGEQWHKCFLKICRKFANKAWQTSHKAHQGLTHHQHKHIEFKFWASNPLWGGSPLAKERQKKKNPHPCPNQALLSAQIQMAELILSLPWV